MLDYYRAVSKAMLPHLRGRPLALQRWPNGIDKTMWFQQNAPPKVPEFVRLVPVADRLTVKLDPQKLTIHTVLARLDKYGDLLAPLLKGKQTL